MPTVSVIVPNYCHAPYLEQRIESILQQTFQDFELILLDDCSTDGSREILERYRNHPKVSGIFYNERNSGSPFKQWKKGLSKATGDYVWIAESDDFSSPCFLERCVRILDTRPDCSIVFTSSYIVDSHSRTIREEAPVKYPKHKQIRFGSRFFLYRFLCPRNTIYNAGMALVRRSALPADDLIIRFDDNDISVTDWYDLTTTNAEQIRFYKNGRIDVRFKDSAAAESCFKRLHLDEITLREN